jgi:hypothetical protein
MDKAKVIEELRNAISAATAPEVMSQEDALEVLEEVAADVDGMIDALKVEIGRG